MEMQQPSTGKRNEGATQDYPESCPKTQILYVWESPSRHSRNQKSWIFENRLYHYDSIIQLYPRNYMTGNSNGNLRLIEIHFIL